MIVNIFFDEKLTDADVIEIPQSVLGDIENIKSLFFKWLFDKSNNHKYWVIINGEKKYCSYRSDAFIEWLNNIHLKGTDQKAVYLDKQDIDNKRSKIIF